MVALLIAAVVIGTPGCEGGVVRQLIRRGRGEPEDRPMFCLAGLHAIDAWEERRPGRQ